MSFIRGIPKFVAHPTTPQEIPSILSMISVECGRDEKVFFFVDVSGSTTNYERYHSLSYAIYKCFLKLGIDVIIVGWDSSFGVITKEQYNNIVMSLFGYGSTQTSNIARFLETQKDKKCHIFILTDGEVEHQDISFCDQILERVLSNNGIEILSMHAFICNRGKTNCSVLAPFFRGNWSSYIFHDNHKEISPVYHMTDKMRREITIIINTITTQREFDEVYDRIISYITSMTMGKNGGNIELRSFVLEMSKRIKENIKKAMTQISPIVTVEEEFFDTKNISVPTAMALVDWYNIQFKGGDFQKKIDFLIKLCDGGMSSVYDPAAIRTAAHDRATVPTSEQSSEQLEETLSIPSDVQPVQCEILMIDTKNPVIMIRKNPVPVFDQLTKGQQDFYRTNTFSACNFTELLLPYLDHQISLEAYLAYPDKDISPTTRQPIIGCLILGADEASVKHTNYVIGKMMNGKSGVIGNPDVLFYVLYHIIKSGNAPWLNDIIPMMEAQLRYRMTHSKCTILMSSNAAHMQLKTKWGVSLFFVILQPLIKIPTKESTFSLFSGSINHIMTLLRLFGCSIPEPIIKFCDIVHLLSKLNAECKSLQITAFKAKYRALIGNFYHLKVENIESSPFYKKMVDEKWFVEYIPLDGLQIKKPDFTTNLPDNLPDDLSDDIKQNLRDEYIKLMYNLSCLIDNGNYTTTALVEKINIDEIDKYWTKPQPPEDDWPLYVGPIKLPETPIHPATLRPYFTTPNGHQWKDSFQQTYGGDHFTQPIFDNTDARKPSGQVFSGASMYGDFVIEYKAHPTFEEFVLYCYIRCSRSQYKHKTIPNIEFCEDVIRDYTPFREIPIEEFIAKYIASRKREDRIRIEIENPIE